MATWDKPTEWSEESENRRVANGVLTEIQFCVLLYWTTLHSWVLQLRLNCDTKEKLPPSYRVSQNDIS